MFEVKGSKTKTINKGEKYENKNKKRKEIIKFIF